jgi:hypothetical protein
MKQRRHVGAVILSAMSGVLLIALCGCGSASGRHGAQTTPAPRSGGVLLSPRAAAIAQNAAGEVARECGPGSSFWRKMAAISQHGLSVELAQSGGVNRAALGRAVQQFLLQRRIYGAGAHLTIGSRQMTVGVLDTKLYDELAAVAYAEPCDAQDAARLGGAGEPSHRAPL